MAGTVHYGLWYDFRNPPRLQPTFEQVYRESRGSAVARIDPIADRVLPKVRQSPKTRSGT